MAFLDTVGKVAKNVGNKTSDIVSVNKLNLKINTQNKKIQEAKEKLGDYRLRRLRPRERRRARTFLPLAVAILLRKPCTLLR